jgi:thioredoxin 1
MPAEFTDANFEAEVLRSDKLTIIDFWALWCPSCIALGPTMDILSKTYEGSVNIGKVNVDEQPNISLLYGITNIPCVLFLKDGKVIDKQVGAAPKQVFEQKIQRLLHLS